MIDVTPVIVFTTVAGILLAWYLVCRFAIAPGIWGRDDGAWHTVFILGLVGIIVIVCAVLAAQIIYWR